MAGGCSLGLALEAAEGRLGGFGEELCGNGLDGNTAFDHRVEALVHRAHRSRARRRGRCRCRHAVALQAGAALDGDRACRIGHAAGGGLAFARQVGGGGIGVKFMDQVDFPFDRTVTRAGGVQRGFVVAEVGVPRVPRAEDFGGRTGRHGLRQKGLGELRLQQRPQQRLDLLHGGAPHRPRRLHRQPRAAQRFRFRVVVEQAVRALAETAMPALNTSSITRLNFSLQPIAVWRTSAAPGSKRLG